MGKGGGVLKNISNKFILIDSYKTGSIQDAHKIIFHSICETFENLKCLVVADNKLRKIYKGKSLLASEKDWSTEYLAPKISIKSVKNVHDAVAHINKYGTMHTDAIICKNKKTSNIFLKNVKSAIAMHNTSTQFADGGEFGFGGEVGRSTNNMPPRGPVGLKQLTSYKYEVIGSGQIRK